MEQLSKYFIFSTVAFFTLSNAIHFTTLSTKPIAGFIHQDFGYRFGAVHDWSIWGHTFYLKPLDLLPQYEFHISIERGDEVVCSGALITGRQHAITAASCDIKNTDTVRIHSPKILNGGKIVGITCFKNHPNFRKDTKEYDIAILALNETIQGAVLYVNSPGTLPNSAQVTSYAVSAKKSYQNMLVITNVPIIPQDKCRLYGIDLTETVLCAGHFALNTSWCSPNQGSPLFDQGKLIGIKLWSQQCTRIAFPSVYTDVANMQDWIWETVEDLWKNPLC